MVCKGGFLDHVFRSNHVVAPTRPLTWAVWAEHCAKEHVHESDAGGEIDWDDVQDSCKYAALDSFAQNLQHCIKFLEGRLKLARRKFYIGVTHCPIYRWSHVPTPKETLIGHKWDRRHRYRVMYVLLKCRGCEKARGVEEALVLMVHDGGIKLPDPGIPASQLIINQRLTPRGPLRDGPDCVFYVYLCSV